MSQTSIDISNAATVTQLQGLGNSNTNGVQMDLQPYKGPVTIILATSQSTVGVGTLNVANIETSADNTAWTAVTGGAFTAQVNTANASNVGVQSKTFDVRALSRYLRCRTEISGTNANIPLTVVVVAQKERGT